ncbi:hypothetical protein SELMODRAFT_17005, partial [Selaginella moellendorffii]
SVYLLNLVVEMYGQCGSVRDAKAAFDSIQEKNQYSWNILIAAFAANGEIDEALAAFERAPSVNLGENPSEATYAAAISACVHLGLMEESQRQFRSMVLDLDRAPNVKLYSSMADLLGRAGEV